MKSLCHIPLLFLCLSGQAQLLTWSPLFIRDTTTVPIEITVDATRGNKGLNNYSSTSDVYVHIGVITSLSTSATDWKYVKFSNFNAPGAAVQCVFLGDNRWRFTMNGGLRSFFGITNSSERILRIAILFRSGNGSIVQRNADGSDMYVPVYDNGLAVRIDEPFLQPLYTPVAETLDKKVGDSLFITARASAAADLRISLNGSMVSGSASAASLQGRTLIATPGEQLVVAQATAAGVTVADTLRFFVSSPPPVLPLPSGMRDGINFEPGGTSATLVLYAPGKSNVYVIGDFNDWRQAAGYQMAKTPDGNRHWLRISGLSPEVEYAYQFLVDGTLRVADYYAEKVLDPWHDKFIPASTYPNLKAYPQGKTTGVVSVMQIRKPAYTWRNETFTRPDKRNLVIYELLLRDFLAAPNWRTLTDTLPYLKRLGVNVVQLMPVNEFEGNSSWGYNPSFYFAPDKYYGTENELRRFIDSCHSLGMAVTLDIALNHSFGQSPMVQLYFDQAASKPSASSPWFNPDARHPFNVGYDFNHESAATRDFTDRVIEHWLTQYRIDGFRWDLSKGFTQTNNPSNVNAWGAFDASRVAIWKRIYDRMQAVSPGSYCILEHFADNSEETVLADYGMLLWGNMNFNFNEATMGYTSNSDLSRSLASVRGWSQPHLIAYQESHDEERLMYKNVNFGATGSGYSVRTLSTALQRQGMAAAFWALMPGPKMLWQFGELGYDYSITYCPSSQSVPQPYPDMQCRTDPKPVRWDYRGDADRARLLNIHTALLRLRNTPAFRSAFIRQGHVSASLSGGFKRLRITDDSLNLLVIGNFDVRTLTDTASFPKAGTVYDYLNRTTFNATGQAQSFTLEPGQYHVFIDRNLSNNLVTSVGTVDVEASDLYLSIAPNPTGGRVRVGYRMDEGARVDIAVWDQQGRRVAQLFSGRKPAGQHMLEWDASMVGGSGISPGIYLLTVDAGPRRMRKALVVGR